MRRFRPSPAMIVAMVALVVSTAGTATAATLITGKQVKNRSIEGIDIANGAISPAKLRDRSVTPSKLHPSARGAAGGGQAIEVVRPLGPSGAANQSVEVARLRNVPAGAYVVMAKTVLSPDHEDPGILAQLLQQGKTATGRCRLDAAGATDDALSPIASLGSAFSSTLALQTTRTTSQPADMVLTCDADRIRWRAGATSIVAMPVGSLARQGG